MMKKSNDQLLLHLSEKREGVKWTTRTLQCVATAKGVHRRARVTCKEIRQLFSTGVQEEKTRNGYCVTRAMEEIVSL